MARKPHLSVILTILFLAGVAGCTQQSPTSAEPPATATGPASAATPSGAGPGPSPAGATSPARTDEAFPLAVTRRGGFAGVQERAMIAADGTVVVTRGGSSARTTLPAGTVTELRRLLTSPDFAGPAQATTCSDGYEYEFVGPSSTRRVYDCDGGHGATTDRVLAVIAELFRR